MLETLCAAADASAGVRPAERTQLPCSGAEQAALAEHFRHGAFLLGLATVWVSAAVELVLLPLRDYPPGTHDPRSGVVAAALLAAATPFAIWRSGRVYGLLARHLTAELALVAVAAALVSLVHPLISELWWPSCTIVMLVALLAGPWRALAYSFAVLLANLAAHLAAADLATTPTEAIVGLWIGYPVLTLWAAVVPERMVARLLALHARSDDERSPLRVPVWILAPDRVPSASAPASPPDGPAPGGSSEQVDGSSAVLGRETRLTARQLQVVALLADGLHYSEVGDCLEISVRQVERHVNNAVRRLELHNVNELVAAAVAAGMVADRCG